MSSLHELLELEEPPVEAPSRRFHLPRLGVRGRIRKPQLRLPHVAQDRVTDLAFLAGLAAIAAGCGWIFPPTAPIVGGAFLAAVAWLEQRGRDDEGAPPPRLVERWYSDGGDDDEEGEED